MASNIGTSNTFATSNMRPAAGEQADALWAQNLADDVGFLYHREILLPAQLDTDSVWGVKKTPAHNGFKVFAFSSDAAAGVCYIRVYPTGTTLVTANEVLAGTFSVPAVAYGNNTYKLNISSLTNGSYYDFVYDSAEDSLRAAYLIHGTDASY